MNRRRFLQASIGAMAGTALGCATGGRTGYGKRPNVVLLFADDLGYADLGAYGGTEIPTPNIDSIARDGVRFTDGYVSCPVCSPTRAGLMTGRYQQRFGHEFNPGPAQNADPDFGLPLSETTIADRLRAEGYATGMFGKWHLGYEPRFNPLRRGFDEFYGFLGGAHSYLDAKADPANLIWNGETKVDSVEYTTDAFAREAASFIERHAGDPFFCYLPFNAVHGPLQAPDRYLNRFNHIGDTKRRTYAAMLSAMDDGVGTVLQALRTTGNERNTLVFFISDNGGPTLQTTSRNNPLRGFKGQTYEGGIRVPFMMKWPDRLPRGTAYTKPVIALDVLPTALRAAGGMIAPDMKLDGVDLTPCLKSDASIVPHEILYWRFGRRAAIRRGDWKLVKNDDEPLQLFNLAEDIGESNDLTAKYPDRVAALRNEYEKWNAQLMAPRWEGRQPRPRNA